MKKFFCAFAALFAISFFCGCAQEDKRIFGNRYCSYYIMRADAVLSINDYFNVGDAAERFVSLCDETGELLESIDKSLSATDSSSPVYRFNEASPGEKVEMDKTSYEVLKSALDICELTDGAYNPAVYYSVRAYGFGGSLPYPDSEEELPGNEEVGAYAELASHFEETELTQEGVKYYATKPDAVCVVDGKTLAMKIDLGGIGKGYAADKVNELIDRYGFEYGYFNFGSSSIALKRFKPDSGFFTMGFTDPRGGYYGSSYFEMNVSDTCVSTSGDYEQFYSIGDVRYCHIIDPFTGKPVQNGIMTATVIGGSAAENDAYTTAIMVMGAEKAIEFIETKLSDRQVVFSYEGTLPQEPESKKYFYYTNIEEGGYKVVNPSKYSPYVAGQNVV